MDFSDSLSIGLEDFPDNEDLEIPEELPNAIIIAQSMDRELIETVPSALSGTATGLGYAHDTVVLLGLTQYILNLGYRAVASMNDSSLAIPYAIKAGLGEYSRLGLLITKEFGPRVRLAAVFTSIEDLPATANDEHAWIEDFCRECVKCVRQCPPGAIASEPVRHPSGRLTWIDHERCLPYFVRNNGCSICIAVCPFHQRDYDWLRERWDRHGERAAELRANPPAHFPEHLRTPPLS